MNWIPGYLDVHTHGQRVKELNDHYKLLFPITLQYLWNTKNKYMDYISQILKAYYFHDKEISEDTAEEMTQVRAYEIFLYFHTS